MTAGWRRLGLALIALGLALRVLIAPGMMPVSSPDGLTLTLCTAQGPVTYTLDVHGEQPPGEPHDPCPYGALSAAPLVPLAAVFTIALPFGPMATLLFDPAEQRPHIAAPAPPPPPTGPPVLL